MGGTEQQNLTNYPEINTSHGWASFLPWAKSTARRNSHMGHVMTSIRGGLAYEQEKRPSNVVDDFEDRLKFAEHSEIANEPKRAMLRTSSDASDDLKGSISPAIEAQKSSEMNENNMGPQSHQKPTTWGWPGLGTYPEFERLNARLENRAKSRKISSLEPRFEAATLEAIDSAAESESYGWPGLGTWPSSKK